MLKSRPDPIIYFFFFLSGATSLVYEVTWFKYIQYLFGSTTYSVTTLLAAFMGGLAIGSYLIGRFANTLKKFLLVYGILELFIGIYALAFPFIFHLLKGIYLHSDTASQSFGWSLFIRLLLSFIALAPPTIAMGGTLPTLAQFITTQDSLSARKIGFLYAFNTLGACAGSTLAAFYFIETLGIQNCLILGAVINLLIGTLSFILYYTFYRSTSDVHQQKNANNNEEKKERTLNLNIRILLICAATGAIALSYEIIFTRLFSLITLNTVYAFAIMLSAFLAGIALGSLFISFFVDRIQKKYPTIALLMILLAFLSFISMHLFEPAFRFSYAVDERYFGNWALIVFIKFLLFFILLLPITFIFGALFPLYSKIILSNTATVGKDIGILYYYNTAGAIAGSLFCGFVFIPLIGVAHTVFLLITLSLLLAGYLLFLEPPSAVPQYAWLIVLLIPYILILFFTDPSSLISKHKVSSDEKMLFFKEGIDSAVMVTLNTKDNSKLLYQNNEWVANTKAVGHKISGHLPAFLSPEPDKILVVGLGSGITARAAALHSSVHQVDIVEISPTMIEASRYFEKDNKDILANPKIHLYLDDVRHFLQQKNRIYNIIVHEPLQQWTAGTVNLYTKEYYELCKSHLNQNGLISQWVQLNTLSANDLALITKTFLSVFPNSSAWLVGKELYLVGINGDFTPDSKNISAKTASEQNALLDLINDPFNSPYQLTEIADLFALLFLDAHELTALSSPASLITDNKPVMEYSVARSIATVSKTTALRSMFSLKTCTNQPANFIINDEPLQSAWNTICQSKLFLYQGIAESDDGNLNNAIDYLKKAYALRPKDKIIQKTIASLLVQQGYALRKKVKDEQAASKKFQEALLYCPDYYDAFLKYGESLQLFGKSAEAKNYYLQAIAAHPELPEAYNHLGILYARYDFNVSRKLLYKAIALSRYNQDYYYNLGALCYRHRLYHEAHYYLSRALWLNDSSKLAPAITFNLRLVNQSIEKSRQSPAKTNP